MNFKQPSKQLSSKELGKKAEELAIDFFSEKGYRIIEKNYRTKTGEIDLIIKDKNGCIIFVEVKARYGEKFGMPQEAVTRTKQRQIIRTSYYYIQKKKLYNQKMRFDVLAIRFSLGCQPSFEHIPFAFENILEEMS